MAKEVKKALVPKLRFPEFRGAEGWDLEHGDKLFDAVNSRSPSETLPILAITQEHGAIPRDQIDYHVSVTEQSIESYKVVEKGDFIISLRSFQGGIEYSNYRGICSPAYVILRRKGEGSDGYFRYLFKSARFIQQLTRNIEGLRDGKMISYKQFSEQRIPVAMPLEQQKIADCLSSLDELIALQGRKVEALKTYKRGLMQQLFPREGETLPRLRFPEFRDAPEWEEQTLRSICIRIMDGTHFSPKSKEGPRPYLTSKNIRNGHIDLSTISYISEDEHREIYTRCPVKKDDILLTKDGANTGNCAINTLDFEFSLLSSVAVLRGDAALVKQNFLYQTITSERTQSNIINSMSGQAITRITLEKLGNFVVSLPNLAEQQRIAQFLSFFDTQIMAEADKFAALNLQKKGLLQQLFPSMGEA